jgi:ssDNA-specific exonuclease RecJ
MKNKITDVNLINEYNDNDDKESMIEMDSKSKMPPEIKLLSGLPSYENPRKIYLKIKIKDNYKINNVLKSSK